MNNNNLQEPLPLLDKGSVEGDSLAPRLLLFQENIDRLLVFNHINQEFSRCASGKNSRSNSNSSINNRHNNLNIYAYDEINIYNTINCPQQNQGFNNNNSCSGIAALQQQKNSESMDFNGKVQRQRKHVCTLSQTNLERCSICNANMKIFFHYNVANEIEKPWDVFYADFSSIFAKKMYMQDSSTLSSNQNHQYYYKNNRKKVFLQLNDFLSLKEWVHYVSNRGYGWGLEDFLQQDKDKVPFILLNHLSNQQLPLTQQQHNAATTTYFILPEKPTQEEIGCSLLNSDVVQLQSGSATGDGATGTGGGSTHLQEDQESNSQGNQQPQQCKQAAISLQLERLGDPNNIIINQNQCLSNNCSQQINMEDGNNIVAEEDEDSSVCQKFMVLGDFEGANIHSCQINKKGDKCNLLLKSDSNTMGCTHWFMFAVLAKEPCTVTFTVLNNKRRGDLYKEGMQIAIYNNLTPERGWHRGGENIFYYKSNVDHSFYRTQKDYFQQQHHGKKKKPNRFFHSLDFTYTFTKAQQRVVFAYCYPYTQSDLNNFLMKQEDELKKRGIKDFNNNCNSSSPSPPDKAKDTSITPTFNNQSPLSASMANSQNQNQPQSQYISKGKQHFNNSNSITLNEDKSILKIRTHEVYYKKKILTASRLGLPVLYLKITSNRQPGQYKKRGKRKVIYILARQHAAETPGSYACSGLIRFLLSDSVQAQFLRELYIFKIFPMLNPDGVSIGNARASLSGHDLNRRWQNPDPILNPEIYYTKMHIIKTLKHREITLLVDLHGHSQKKHAFMYGCNKTFLSSCQPPPQQQQEESNSGEQGSHGFRQTRAAALIEWIRVRLYPRIMATKSPTFFSLEDCRFKVTEDRVSTARVVSWLEFGIQNAYTLETSFFGYTDSSNEGKATHFTIDDLESLGKDLGLSFVDFTIILQKLLAEKTKDIMAASRGIFMLPQQKIQQSIALTSLNTNNNTGLSSREQKIFSFSASNNGVCCGNSLALQNNNNAGGGGAQAGGNVCLDKAQQFMSVDSRTFAAVLNQQQQQFLNKIQQQTKVQDKLRKSITPFRITKSKRKKNGAQIISGLVNNNNLNNDISGSDASPINFKGNNNAYNGLSAVSSSCFYEEYSNPNSTQGQMANNSSVITQSLCCSNNQKNNNSSLEQQHKRNSVNFLANSSNGEITCYNNSQHHQQQQQQQQLSMQQQLFLQQLSPYIMNNWRDYFTRNELEQNFKIIEQGGDPNDYESDTGSDSQPEIDLYDDGDFPYQKTKKQEYDEGGDCENEGNEDEVTQTRVQRHCNNKCKSNRNGGGGQSSNSHNKQNNNLTCCASNSVNKCLLPNSNICKKHHHLNGIQPQQQQLFTQKKCKKQSYPLAKVGQTFYDWSLKKEQFARLHKLDQHNQQSPPICQLQQQDKQDSSPLQQNLQKINENPINKDEGINNGKICIKSPKIKSSQSFNCAGCAAQGDSIGVGGNNSEKTGNLNQSIKADTINNSLNQSKLMLVDEEAEIGNQFTDCSNIQGNTNNNRIRCNCQQEGKGSQMILSGNAIPLYSQLQQQQLQNSSQLQPDIGQIIQQKLREGNGNYIPISQIYSNKLFKKQKIYDTIIQQQLALSLNYQPNIKQNQTAQNYFSIQKTETDFVIKKINVLPKYQLANNNNGGSIQQQHHQPVIRSGNLQTNNNTNCIHNQYQLQVQQQQQQQQANSNNCSLNNSKLCRQNSLLHKRNNSQDSLDIAAYANNSSQIHHNHNQHHMQFQQKVAQISVPSPYLQQPNSQLQQTNEQQSIKPQQEAQIANEFMQSSKQEVGVIQNEADCGASQQQITGAIQQQLQQNKLIQQQQQQQQQYQQIVVIQPTVQYNHIQLEPLKLQLSTQQILGDSSNQKQDGKTGKQRGQNKQIFQPPDDMHTLLNLQKQINNQQQQQVSQISGINSGSSNCKDKSQSMDKQRLLTHSSGNKNNSGVINQLVTQTTSNSGNQDGRHQQTANLKNNSNKSNFVLGSSVDDGIFKLKLYYEQKNQHQQQLNQESLIIKNFNFNGSHNSVLTKKKQQQQMQLQQQQLLQQKQQGQSPERTTNISSLVAQRGAPIMFNQQRSEFVTSHCYNRQACTLAEGGDVSVSSKNNNNNIGAGGQNESYYSKVSQDFADQFFKIFKTNKNIYQEDIDYKKSVLFKELLYSQLQNADNKQQRGSSQGGKSAN